MLTMSYRFENSPNDSEFESFYDNVTGTFYYPNGYRMKSVNDAGGKEHTGQIDYVNPFTSKHSIEAGLKYIYRDNSSRADNTFYTPASGKWQDDMNRKTTSTIRRKLRRDTSGTD